MLLLAFIQTKNPKTINCLMGEWGGWEDLLGLPTLIILPIRNQRIQDQCGLRMRQCDHISELSQFEFGARLLVALWWGALAHCSCGVG